MTDTLTPTITPLPTHTSPTTHSSQTNQPEMVIDLRSDDAADHHAVDHHAVGNHAARNRAGAPRAAKAATNRRPKRTAATKTHHHRGSERRQRIRPRRYERLEEVFGWAETEGLVIDTEALLLIVETEADFETWPPDCWTEHGLWQFLWSEISTACVLAGRTEPLRLCETMWLYLRFLDLTVGLAAGSDSIDRLHGFLQEYGDLNDDGRSRAVLRSNGVPAGQFQLDLESAA